MESESTLNLLAGLSISGTPVPSDPGSNFASSVSSDKRNHGRLGDGLTSALSSAIDPNVSERSIPSSGNMHKLQQVISQARNEAAAKRKQVEEARQRFIALKPAVAGRPVPSGRPTSPSPSPSTPLANSSNGRTTGKDGASSFTTTPVKPAPALPKLTLPVSPSSTKQAAKAPAQLAKQAPMPPQSTLGVLITGAPTQHQQRISDQNEPQHSIVHSRHAGKRIANTKQQGLSAGSAAQGSKTGSEWLDPVKVRQEQREKIRKNMRGVGRDGTGKAANGGGEADEHEGGARL